MKVKFFRSPALLRAWFAKHHDTAQELLVGYFKVNSGKPSVTWPESVDEALCFGWIDGIRRRIDDASYTIRFTPRKPRSIWSSVNIGRAQALVEEGRMQPAGLVAFEARQENRSGIYSYEQRSAVLGEPYQSVFKKSAAGWKFFAAQPASYRKAACWWVTSAKREETRLKRLSKLIEDSDQGRWIPQFMRTNTGKTRFRRTDQ